MSTPEAAEPSVNHATYVYGIVRAGLEALPPDRSGVGEQPLRLVEHQNLGALVSDAPAGLETGRRTDLLAHANVLEAVAAQATVLPMRFGMTMANEEAVVAQVLVDGYEQWEALLDRFEGRVELTLKAYHDEESTLRRVVDEEPEVQRLRGKESTPERIRLGELVAEALEERRRADAEWVLERLRPLTEDVRAADAVPQGMTLSASLLISRVELDRFDEELEQLGSEAQGHLRLRCVGPLPPYSFVNEQ